MHDPQLLEQFLVLRVLGHSIPKIAKKMRMPASTLYDWNERARTRIQHLRLRRLEEAMAGGDHTDATLRRYAEAQARLEHAGGYAWREHTNAVVRGLGFADEDLEIH